MNREIKFRAWDGEKMIIVNDIVFSGDKPKAYWRENSVTESSEIIMQFTGLLDKNGKEIYEGDILKRSGVKRHDVVGFEDGSFTIEFNGGGNDILQIFNKESTVIGNIYSNPELLNQTPAQ